MMDGMGGLEPERPMHQAVRPIKPSIVRKQIEKNRHRHIPKRKCADIGVNLRPAKIVPAPSHNTGRDAIDGSTGKAPANLSLNLVIKASIKSGFPDFGRPGKGTADKQIARPHNHRHGRSRHNQDKQAIHLMTLDYLQLS